MNVRQCAKSDLPAGDAAHVAGPLAEANLELGTAPARTRRLILDCGSGRNCRQGVASVVAGAEAVAANALIAGPASDRNILAQLDRAAVGAGLKARLTGLAVVAGGNAGAALRGAVRLRRGRLPSQRHGEESEASRGYEKNAHVPVSAPKGVADPGMIAGLSAFVVGHAARRPRNFFEDQGGKGLKVKMTPSLSLHRYSLHLRRTTPPLG